ncbi:MAG: hypothetical protein ABSB22_12815 [Thermodesulfobacteriota bacterium]|jgi:hypothetical protein
MKGYCPKVLNETPGDSFIFRSLSILGNVLLYNRQRLQAFFSYIFRQSFMVFVVLLIMCTGVHCLVAQTCIVIRRTPSEVVVGADSKIVTITFSTDSDGKEKQIRTAGTKCKIRQAGNTFFAISGVDIPDMDNLADASCKGGRNYIEKAARFKALITEPLSVALEWSRLLNPDFYQKKFMRENACLQIVFFGIEDGFPAYRVINFLAINPLSEPVHITQREGMSCPGALPATKSVTSVIGHNAAIRALNLTEDFWKGLDTIAGIRKLISIESNAMSEEVGGEIDIIRVTRHGARWVQKKTECPDIQNTINDKPNSLSKKKRR